MNLVIAGTIGLDDIKTPFGDVLGVLGGSGVYAAVAASFFDSPGLISIAGEDLPKEYVRLLKRRRIDLSGIEFAGKTFRWSGEYEFDMNEAKTKETELNSLATFRPVVPKSYKDAKILLLGNIDPILQLEILDQFDERPFVVADTMNYWISSKKHDLLKLIHKIHLLVLNEGEARQLMETPNLIKAGRALVNLGPEYVIIKKGEHGALLFSHDNFFSAPSYPLEEVKDPTGAGDSFAGGLAGYLAMTNDTSWQNLRKAIIYGSAIASCCAEDFSIKYLDKTRLNDIKERYNVFEQIKNF